MFLGQQVSVHDPNLSRTYQYFSDNLRDIISLSKEAGAYVILSTFAANLRDSPPFHSAHKADLSTEEIKAWEQKWSKGKELEAEGEWAAALEAYQAAETIDADYAELEFRIGRCLLKLGDRQRAKNSFQNAEELDTLRFRADTAINAAVRAVAMRESHDASLVDAASLFATEAADGVPGNEFFFDHVHLRPHGNYLLATELLRKIEPVVQDKLGTGISGKEVLTEEQCDRLLALTEYDRTRLARIMQHRLSRPPFTDQAYNAERLGAFQEEEREHTAALDTSVIAYEWALQQSPGDYLLRENFGLLLYPFNRSASLSELRLSRPYHDIPLDMPDGTRVE